MKFDNYLNSLEWLTEPIKERIYDIVNISSFLSSEEIRKIFISEYLDSDSKRVYECLWCFSDNYAMEAKNFRAEYNVDVVNFSQIIYLRVQSNYRLTEVKEDSRLVVELCFPHNLAATVKATGTNCRFLETLISDTFKHRV